MKKTLHYINWLAKLCPAFYPVMIAKTLFSVLSPYITLYMSAVILNEILGERRVGYLITVVLFTVVLNCILGLLAGLFDKIYSDLSDKLDSKILMIVNESPCRFDYSDFESPEVNQLYDEIQGILSSSRGPQMLKYGMGKIIEQTLNLIFSLALFSELFILAAKNGSLLKAIALEVAVVLILVFTYIWRDKETKAKNAAWDKKEAAIAESNHISRAVDSYNLGKDTRIYRLKELILGLKKSAQKERYLAQKKENRTILLYSLPSILMNYSISIITYMLVCMYAAGGIVSIGSVPKYIGAFEKLVSAVRGLISYVTVFKNNTPYMEKFFAYISRESKMTSGTKSVPRSDSYVFELKDVSFKYPGSEAYALKNVSMKIGSTNRSAIVGINGSGKTTLVKLLCRLYDPTSGVILLNGVDIREYKYDEYMKIFSVVFQDFSLLSLKAGENVAASVDYDAEKVKECFKLTGITEFDPETYLYNDYKDGIELSGGEAQKIAIARAIYRNSPCMILDEPTAALDPLAESEIYKLINQISSDKMIIYISHRLSSCRFADCIYVFDEGALVESGTHEELLQNKALYSAMWNSQAQYYE